MCGGAQGPTSTGSNVMVVVMKCQSQQCPPNSWIYMGCRHGFTLGRLQRCPGMWLEIQVLGESTRSHYLVQHMCGVSSSVVDGILLVVVSISTSNVVAISKKIGLYWCHQG